MFAVVFVLFGALSSNHATSLATPLCSFSCFFHFRFELVPSDSLGLVEVLVLQPANFADVLAVIKTALLLPPLK